MILYVISRRFPTVSYPITSHLFSKPSIKLFIERMPNSVTDIGLSYAMLKDGLIEFDIQEHSLMFTTPPIKWQPLDIIIGVLRMLTRGKREKVSPAA
jgi:hypothetical protein